MYSKFLLVLLAFTLGKRRTVEICIGAFTFGTVSFARAFD